MILLGIRESEVKMRVDAIIYIPEETKGIDYSLGIEVSEIPKSDSTKIGYHSQLYINPQTKEMWYEYVERPKTQEEKIADLEEKLAIAEQDNLNTMLALTEVYETMLAGGAV